MIRKYEELVKGDKFIRQAMVIALISLMLEITGQLYISVVTSLGYYFYFIQ